MVGLSAPNRFDRSGFRQKRAQTSALTPGLSVGCGQNAFHRARGFPVGSELGIGFDSKTRQKVLGLTNLELPAIGLAHITDDLPVQRLNSQLFVAFLVEPVIKIQAALRVKLTSESFIPERAKR